MFPLLPTCTKLWFYPSTFPYILWLENISIYFLMENISIYFLMENISINSLMEDARIIITLHYNNGLLTLLETGSCLNFCVHLIWTVVCRTVGSRGASACCLLAFYRWEWAVSWTVLLITNQVSIMISWISEQTPCSMSSAPGSRIGRLI